MQVNQKGLLREIDQIPKHLWHNCPDHLTYRKEIPFDHPSYKNNTMIMINWQLEIGHFTWFPGRAWEPERVMWKVKSCRDGCRDDKMMPGIPGIPLSTLFSLRFFCGTVFKKYVMLYQGVILFFCAFVNHGMDLALKSSHSIWKLWEKGKNSRQITVDFMNKPE